MSLGIYFIAFVIVMCSAMIQAMTSFGFALLAVPLLSFIMPLKIIVPIIVIYSLVINIIIFTIPIFIMNKMVSSEMWDITLKLSPALFIGVTSGIFFGNRLPDNKFRKITLTLIFTMGILAIMSSI